MADRLLARRGAYRDSVTLMLVSRQVASVDGVEDVAVVMATPLNVELLRAQGFDLDAAQAGPNDLVLALRARDEASLDAAVAAVDAQLAGDRTASARAGERWPPRSLAAAARRDPSVSLAFVSVPGRHAAYEAAAALEAGLDVLCFSDGVSVAHEAVLKRRARELGLLLMGPDCGTAILDGVALGFANAVRRGPVGIVGASGTGMQEVSCLLDAAGVGVSHAIGVGGRDLTAEVGGGMCRRGIELLAGDPGTKAIVVVSKPPDPEVADRVAQAAGDAGKPVVLAYLGLDPASAALPAGVEHAGSLQAAAARAADLVGAALPAFEERLARPPVSGWVRGLFCGGTLCKEAMSVLAPVGSIASNVPLPGGVRLADVDRSEGHTCIDFGEDELTEGRAHPMIDPTIRTARLARELDDPEVGVVLLDVVLGYGAHADPAAEPAALIRRAVDARPELHVIVALCGAEDDPQGLQEQRRRLEDAGAVVTRSNTHASRLALAAVGAGEVSHVGA